MGCTGEAMPNSLGVLPDLGFIQKGYLSVYNVGFPATTPGKVILGMSASMSFTIMENPTVTGNKGWAVALTIHDERIRRQTRITWKAIDCT